MPHFVAEKKLLIRPLKDKQESTPDTEHTFALVRAEKRTSFDSTTRRHTFTLADRAATIGYHSKAI